MDSSAYRRRLLIIYNPTAGRRKRARLEAYLDLLEEAGCAVEYRPTTRRGDAEAFANDALAERYDAVVAAGGDGTIAEVANGLPKQGAAPLGIFPLGTANVLAAEIGLPLAPPAVMDAVLRGPARDIYPGFVESDGAGSSKTTRLFTIMAGVGFDAHVVADLPIKLKRALGKGAYVVESLRQLLSWPGRTYRLEIDGQSHDACSAIIAKGHFYAGRFICCPDARLDAPDFQICLLRRPGKIGVLRASAAMTLGLLPRLPEITLLRGKSVRITGIVGDPVQADGDIAAHLPATVTVGDKPLRLIMPA
ncbi:diacylglycerol/lipid kinase family protein [Ferrovibrio sp.]|uniref:diacylglycerol/lipid kinase family protein n=1 Tax=Ferrovibrio sp. TaxID=1917215 RepID=UPI003D2A1313